MGADKEQWEPTIQRLFDLDATRPTRLIRDAWSLDWQSHGEAGILNRSALLRRDSVCASALHSIPHYSALRSLHAATDEYADLLTYFVTSNYVSGRRIVVVGHSASTSAWSGPFLSSTPMTLASTAFLSTGS